MQIRRMVSASTMAQLVLRVQRPLSRSRLVGVSRFFRHEWPERRGDERDEWGASTWYFEVSAKGIVVRQLEVYETGPAKRYDAAHLEDGDGRMATERLLSGTHHLDVAMMGRQPRPCATDRGYIR